MRPLAPFEGLQLGVDIDVGLSREVGSIIMNRNAVGAVAGRAGLRRFSRVGPFGRDAVAICAEYQAETSSICRSLSPDATTDIIS